MTVSIEEVFAACPNIKVPESVQINYARHVHSAIKCSMARDPQKNGEVFIEADTGVGKTLGYLVPAAISAVQHGARVIVSTYTKSLQRQVIADAAKVVEGIRATTGRELKVARLVGRQNFFDIDKVRSMRSSVMSGESPSSLVKEWDDLIEWLEDPSSSGEIQDYIDDSGCLPGGIQSALVCLDSSSSAEASVRYDEHRATAHDADILVTNHAILCMSAMRGVRLLHRDDDNRPICAVIIDEADRLPDAARSIMADLAPLKVILRLCAKMSEFVPEEVASHLVSIATEMIDASMEIAARNGREAHLIEDLRAGNSGTFKRLENAVIDFVGKINEIKDDLTALRNKPETYELADDLLRYRNVLMKAVINQSEAQTPTVGVIQFSPKRSYPSIALARLYPARILRYMIKYLHEGGVGENETSWQPTGTAVILTSATLAGTFASKSDPFWEMKKQLGVHDGINACSHLHKSFSPVKFGRIEQIVVQDPSVHKPYEGFTDDGEDDEIVISEDWVQQTALMISKAAENGGYVLALANSYRAASMIRLALGNLAPDLHAVLKSRAEHMDSAIRRMLEKGAGVLVTPTGWEGLDARSYGFSWKSVVICQLPIGRADSAYKAALASYLIRRGKSHEEAEAIVYGETMSSAFRKLRQGIGRGIRSADDSFSLYFADPRIPPFGTLLDSDEPFPPRNPANLTMQMFTKAIPRRFQSVPVRMMLRSGQCIE